jgi:hypothetical protein
MVVCSSTTSYLGRNRSRVSHARRSEDMRLAQAAIKRWVRCAPYQGQVSAKLLKHPMPQRPECQGGGDRNALPLGRSGGSALKIS